MSRIRECYRLEPVDFNIDTIRRKAESAKDHEGLPKAHINHVKWLWARNLSELLEEFPYRTALISFIENRGLSFPSFNSGERSD